jgi:DNA-binding CsgD family transcriptional regulator
MTKTDTASRADDERRLEMLRRYGAGQTYAEIARALSVSPQKVIATVETIRAADIAHDPEAAAYWRTAGDPT